VALLADSRQARFLPISAFLTAPRAGAVLPTEPNRADARAAPIADFGDVRTMCIQERVCPAWPQFHREPVTARFSLALYLTIDPERSRETAGAGIMRPPRGLAQNGKARPGRACSERCGPPQPIFGFAGRAHRSPAFLFANEVALGPSPIENVPSVPGYPVLNRVHLSGNGGAFDRSMQHHLK